MVLLGEAAKVVCVSAMRFRRVAAPRGSSSIQVQLAGVAGERVKVFYRGVGAGPAKSSTCTIDTSGECSLTLS